MKSYVLAAAFAAGVMSPAFAAEFWVVMNPSTKRCTIVEQRPAESSTVKVMGDGKVYTSRTEAEGAVKQVCTDSSTGSTTTTTTPTR